MLAESTIALLSFVLTLMVFSYILGDLPVIGSLYRIAVYIFIGMSAAYTLVVSYEGIILPYLLDIQDSSTSWTYLGNNADIALFFTALLFGLLLLLKPFPALAWLTNSVFAALIAVGAAVAVVGAITGTIFPLLQASSTLPVSLDAGLDAWLDAGIIFLGTMTGLFYFHYQLRSDGSAMPRPGRIRQAFRHVGKLFIVCALAAIYASTMLSSLAVLSERISFLFQFGA